MQRPYPLIRHHFFFNYTAPTQIYTLSLHDALPISSGPVQGRREPVHPFDGRRPLPRNRGDRKSTRLNSSHANISYAVFCLKKKIDVNNAVEVSNRSLRTDDIASLQH